MDLWGSLGIDFIHDLMVDGYMVSYVCLCLAIYVRHVFCFFTYPPLLFLEIIVFALPVHEVEMIEL